MHSAITDYPVLQKHKCQFQKFPLGTFSLLEIYFFQFYLNLTSIKAKLCKFSFTFYSIYHRIKADFPICYQ